jgi:cyclin B
MLLASKYEEMYAPEIGDFVFITDQAYDKPKICKTESKMLAVLDYQLGSPLCLHFLRRYSKAAVVSLCLTFYTKCTRYYCNY